jgi:hypothetical protein
VLKARKVKLYIHSLHTSSWCNACLVKHRGNFKYTNIVRVMKTIRIILEGPIVRKEMRNAYKILVGYI